MSGEEAFSRLFQFDLELVSENDSISYDSITGKNVTVGLSLSDNESQRYWNGYVSNFYQAARDSNLAVYRARIVPWLWFLDRTTDCRIFLDKTALDIITQIFGEYGFKDYGKRRVGPFTDRDTACSIARRISNFVSWLMEEEGISYHFERSDGKHTLMMADDWGAYKTCPNQSSARCYLPRNAVRSRTECWNG
jgi:type VI secretion system secreted protein VgrG